MKMKQFYIILLISIFCCGNSFNGFAQSFKYVKYPYVMSYPHAVSSGQNEVYISSITFSSYETRIDFITHYYYAGEYINLEKPNMRNAMYIRAGKNKFNLRYTVGTAETKGIICKQGQTLEFSAHFAPVPDEYRNQFDLIEGIDGTLNFYGISIDKHLGQFQVSDWLYSVDKEFWDKIYNNEIKYRFECQERATDLIIKNKKEIIKTLEKKTVKRNILKKDPNFKID